MPTGSSERPRWQGMGDALSGRMMLVAVALAAASLSLLLREMHHSPEGIEDEKGLSLVEPKLSARFRAQRHITPVSAEALH
jgi:hypothetical protein